MTTLSIFKCAASAIVLAGAQVPARIELMPVGKIELADERGHVGQVTNAAALISRSMDAAAGGVLPIDFGHGMDGDSGADPRAAGWITAMSVEGDRILADVEWTPAGASALEGKEFRFISPTFTAPVGGGELGVILRAGLTNDPALPKLAMLAAKQETPSMPDWLKQLAAKLGMPEETDEAKIAAAVTARIGVATHAASVVTAAGLTGDLTETSATAICAKLTASKDAAPDPTKFVPMAAFKEVTTQLASAQKSSAASEVDTLITAAKTAGKLAPAMEDWARGYAAKDLDGFKAWTASAPVLVAAKTETPAGDPPGADASQLTSEDKAVIVMTAASGVTKETFLASRAADAAATKES